MPSAVRVSPIDDSSAGQVLGAPPNGVLRSWTSLSEHAEKEADATSARQVLR